MTHSEQDYAALPVAVQQRLDALEAQLRDLHTVVQRNATLFAEAPNPAFLLNSQGRITDANAAASGLLGRALDVLLGKRLDQFMSPVSQGSFGTLLKQVSKTSLKQRGEAQLLHLNGAVSDMLVDVILAQHQGDFLHYHVVVTDITTYKQVHQDLLDVEVAQTVVIEKQAATVRSLHQELEQTVTLFVQQLHLPTARAMSFLGLLRQTLGEVQEEVNHPLVNTERSVQQVMNLMASVERYMQARHMRIHLQRVDLQRVFQEVLKNAQPYMVGRVVQITHDPLPTVQGDSQALYLALDEYVANALKFTRGQEKARIHVTVREVEGEYHLGVEDNGTGFNMRSKGKLFRLFGRLHSSKYYEGTGIGLVTVKRVCERFGGRVWGEGKVDQGATFWFAWPKQPSVVA
ncbi:sensor histidine kinase [Deinococcus hopiensis]|uniref:histidine kinase n=1 Tax=Deinococcus hopiensis KR-140 TaxID=695939 RepID=A0A1W1UYG8_9DEIO|nr:ATP-binding protein [Deinococcus hopiensis]SMB86182.1 PAS domain S-box-containing protein [Deinococcus hopiensis KR-140]